MEKKFPNEKVPVVFVASKDMETSKNPKIASPTIAPVYENQDSEIQNIFLYSMPNSPSPDQMVLENPKNQHQKSNKESFQIFYDVVHQIDAKKKKTSYENFF